MMVGRRGVKRWMPLPRPRAACGRPDLLSASDACPVEKTAAILSGKWTLLIIRDLAEGTKRFSALERSLAGISPKTLSERLRALEQQGIVARQAYPEVPVRVEYSLTAKGQALIPVIEMLRRYCETWM